MPEGPEVHREAHRIKNNIGLQTQLNVHWDTNKIKRKLPSKTQLLGVEAFGKAILLHFSDGQSLYSHNQLYGRWHFSDDSGSWGFRGRQRRLRIESSQGWAELYSATDLQWLDSKQVKQHPYIRKLGPDAVNPAVTLAKVLAQFNNPSFQNKTLHALFLQQSFVAGVGNYLRSEILFRSALNPWTRLGELDTQGKKTLAEKTLNLCRQSFNTGGITLDLDLSRWSRQYPEIYGNRNRFWVFARQKQACWVCSSSIIRHEASNRRIYACPQCQNLP